MLLTDPEDKDSGAKGYVKISISILGPGDKLKIPPKSSSTDDLVDIESNLLRPAGVQLQPATYTVKIYKAEDVPKSKYFIFINAIMCIFNLAKAEDILISMVCLFTDRRSFRRGGICTK